MPRELPIHRALELQYWGRRISLLSQLQAVQRLDPVSSLTIVAATRCYREAIPLQKPRRRWIVRHDPSRDPINARN